MHFDTIVLVSFTPIIWAHMSLWYPCPLGGTQECNLASTYTDPELNFPLGCCDNEGKPTLSSPGVCRGHLGLFEEEVPKVTWQPGQDAYFQLSDYTYTPGAPGSTHYGGSCQVGFSTDYGRSWKAVASYQGNCPHRGVGGSPEVQTFHFDVPTNMPEGKALFGWIWLNREHESFMNCAAVQISYGHSVVGDRTVEPEMRNPNHSLFDQSNAQDKSVDIGGTIASPTTGSALQTYGHVESESCHQTTSKKLSTDRRLLQSLPDNLTRSKKTQGCADVYNRATAKLHEARKSSAACDWYTAPSMAFSYYTVDAACMPNAKLVDDESDTFEVGWEAPCGNVEGDGEYPIKTLDCP